MPHQPLIIVIAGPTASGKTNLAIELAGITGASVISADSRQVYRELKTGTARPSPAELKGVPHFCLGHVSIHDTYTAANFATEAYNIISDHMKRGQPVIVAGGTGLYLKALFEGLDEIPEVPEEVRQQVNSAYAGKGLEWLQEQVMKADPAYYLKADTSNPRRLIRALEVSLASGKPYSSFTLGIRKEFPWQVYKAGLYPGKAILTERINKRTEKMIDEGLVGEARQLLPYRHLNALSTVGYTEIFEYLDSKITLRDAVEKIKTNTRRYAKRQMTWFRKDAEINWSDSADPTTLLEQATRAR